MIRGIDEERRAPKYAHIERERRFLVDPARTAGLPGLPSVLIEDAYIDGTRMRLRRMTASDTARIVLKLTKKYDAPDVLARPIVTTYLTDAEFALLAALPSHPVTKRRYTRDGFSIDVFERQLAGLSLAEIEQPDGASLHAVSPPAWAGREVSDDPFFQGGALARVEPQELHARLVALLGQ